MSTNENQGLHKKSTLTDAEITEIAQLVTFCNEQGNLRTRIPLDALHQRSGSEIDDFLYYENSELAGYLYIDSWGKVEKEITGVVKPEFRRRGIFRQLFEAARVDCKERGVKDMILVCEQNSYAAHAFARAVKAHHDFSEHEMILGTFVERQVSDPRFHMRSATPEDQPALISIMATDMGNEEEARQLVEELYKEPEQHFYLAALDEKPLGCLRLDKQGEAVGIYSFIVRPEHRKHGYGRMMLEHIIRRIYDEGPRTIMLEVETTNRNAIGLYESCGFFTRTTYDYFNRTI